MATAQLETTMAGKKKDEKRDDKAVKIERHLATKAKVIAESKGVVMAEYLSDLLRPLISRDWPKALKGLESHGQEDE